MYLCSWHGSPYESLMTSCPYCSGGVGGGGVHIDGGSVLTTRPPPPTPMPFKPCGPCDVLCSKMSGPGSGIGGVAPLDA